MLVIKEPVLSGEITDATIPIHLGCTLAHNAAIRLLCTRPVLRRCAYSTLQATHSTKPQPPALPMLNGRKFQNLSKSDGIEPKPEPQATLKWTERVAVAFVNFVDFEL